MNQGSGPTVDGSSAEVYLGGMDLRPLALVLVLAAQPVAAASDGFDGDALSLYAAYCGSSHAKEPAQWELRTGFCAGYVEATADAARPGLCLPKNVPTSELVFTFRLWGYENFDEIFLGKVPASMAVVIALAERWPCPERAFD